jgi:limonene-1,2-epoxide hydrolase
MTFAALVEQFAAVAATGNGDALADLFCDDGTYVDYFFGSYTGRAAIKGMLAHFAEGGKDFKWTFHDAVGDDRLGYASYRFSYTSLSPDAANARVTFDGMGKFELEGGRIKRYSEVFDRGMALAQQNFAGERLAKIGKKYAAELKSLPEWREHLA